MLRLPRKSNRNTPDITYLEACRNTGAETDFYPNKGEDYVTALFCLPKPAIQGVKQEECRMNEQTDNKNTQQGENDAGQVEKTFTQEEVNKIVQDRLARIKSEPNDKEIKLEQRAKELDMKERKLEAKAIFAEKSLPKELLDILDYSDEEKMKEHIKILEKTYSAGHTGGGYNPVRGGAPCQDDPIREAMGLK